MPRQVGLIDLYHLGLQLRHLFGNYGGKGVGQRLAVPVMAVYHHLGQHVRPGQGELEIMRRNRACTRAGELQVQAAMA